MSLLPDNAEYFIHHGDCVPHLSSLDEDSVDFSCFSPPFPSVFSYTSEECDLGNSEGEAEMKLHFSFFFKAMIRVMKPGRVMMVHCTQIGKNKRVDNEGGLIDFRGILIRLARRAGFVYDYEWCVRTNPQAQAIRTRKWELKFQGLESDRTVSRGSMPDYLIKFRKPGENAVPVDSEDQVSRNDWIEWAECTWDDIKETATLNGLKGKERARGEDDTKHICPLQLGIIDRLVRMYSNPGEIVCSPFCGIGSEGYVSVNLGRRFYGVELKHEYYVEAIRNLTLAVRNRDAQGVLDFG